MQKYLKHGKRDKIGKPTVELLQQTRKRLWFLDVLGNISYSDSELCLWYQRCADNCLRRNQPMIPDEAGYLEKENA